MHQSAARGLHRGPDTPARGAGSARTPCTRVRRRFRQNPCTSARRAGSATTPCTSAWRANAARARRTRARRKVPPELHAPVHGAQVPPQPHATVRGAQPPPGLHVPVRSAGSAKTPCTSARRATAARTPRTSVRRRLRQDPMHQYAAHAGCRQPAVVPRQEVGKPQATLTRPANPTLWFIYGGHDPSRHHCMEGPAWAASQSRDLVSWTPATISATSTGSVAGEVRAAISFTRGTACTAKWKSSMRVASTEVSSMR
jgi:hypothetical protein